MKKDVAFVDIQAVFQGEELGKAEQKVINESLFLTYEILRLWIREHREKAPFRKLVINFVDESTHPDGHGKVFEAIGICQVTEAVNLLKLRKSSADHVWVLSVVQHALGRVHATTGWRCGELEEVVAQFSKDALPLVHRFSKLSKTDKPSGVRCDLLFAAGSGECQILIRLASVRDELERDVVVLSKQGPLYLEDDFPASKSVIQSGDYLILGKTGQLLARVPIARPA